MNNSDILDGAALVGFLCVRNREKAKDFYTGLLGLPIQHEDGFALVLKVGSNTLRISESKEFKPQPFTVAGWEVSDIASCVRNLAAKHIDFKEYEGLEQDELAIWRSPSSGALIAWFTDPDGNLLSLSQHPAK